MTLDGTILRMAVVLRIAVSVLMLRFATSSPLIEPVKMKMRTHDSNTSLKVS